MQFCLVQLMDCLICEHALCSFSLLCVNTATVSDRLDTEQISSVLTVLSFIVPDHFNTTRICYQFQKLKLNEPSSFMNLYENMIKCDKTYSSIYCSKNCCIKKKHLFWLHFTLLYHTSRFNSPKYIYIWDLDVCKVHYKAFCDFTIEVQS